MTDKTPTDEITQTLKSLEAEWAKAGRSMAAVMPREVAGAFNLMAYPAAAFTASACVSMGAASQAMGMWLSAWSAVAGGAQSATPASPQVRPTEAADLAFTRATTRAKATADTLMSDAKAVADEITKPVSVPVRVIEQIKAKPSQVRKAAVAEGPSAKPVSISKPANPDDLKAISGVGPKLEQVLNGLGVWTYAQIAAFTRAEIDWIEDYLAFKGRIDRDGWQEQAEGLAASVAHNIPKSDR